MICFIKAVVRIIIITYLQILDCNLIIFLVIPDVQEKMKALNLLVLMMPLENRNTFRLLLKFFLNIIENEEYNRMGLRNVAMIIAPSFFPQRLLLNHK